MIDRERERESRGPADGKAFGLSGEVSPPSGILTSDTVM